MGFYEVTGKHINIPNSIKEKSGLTKKTEVNQWVYPLIYLMVIEVWYNDSTVFQR